MEIPKDLIVEKNYNDNQIKLVLNDQPEVIKKSISQNEVEPIKQTNKSNSTPIVNNKTNEVIEKENVEEEEKLKKVAFTFDDGPSIYTENLLEILKENNASATFFVIGSRINKYGHIIEKIKNDGHQIESHGVSHKAFTKLSDEELIEELKTTKELLAKYDVIQTMVRPPYGSVNEKVKQNVNYPLIMWSIDTRDWEHRNSSEGTRIIIENVEDGSIILMHDLYKSTVETVKEVLPILKEKGYEFVTVSDLFEDIELENGKVYYKKIKNK